MKSGIAQLREEKYRFTIETQGLHYTSKHQRLAAQDEDTAWTDDDSDHETAPTKGSSPLAQRMATELTRVLQQGGFTDDTLERLLAGSLQSRPDVAGYDVAKDYIKQVFGQLYGEGDVASSAPTGVAAESRSSSAQAFASTVATVALNHSSTESSDNSGAHGLLLGPAPPSRTPAQHAAHTAASGLTPPPWTGAIGRGPVAGAGAAASSSSAGGADDEPERPRPRPHHGRIKEQLDLLQNADQLAAIISVATTAATTAAAAAVKQTMQTPPPLPPGAYARMHAAGQAVYGLPVVASGHRVPQAMQVAAAGAASARVAADGLGDDSPDPQPQNRQGALVSPHRRSTPMVLMRRPEADVRAAESIEPGAAPGEQDEQPVAGEQIGRAGAALGFEDAQLRRQRLRWSQRRGMPLAPAPARDVDGDTGAVSLGDAGSINANVGAVNSAAAGGDAGNSNLRMVRLGVPKITARTPTPARQLRAIVGDLRPLHDQQVQRGDVLHMGAGSRTAEAETRPSSYEPAAMRAVEWPAGAAHAGQADQPGRLPAPISNSCNSVRQQQQPGMQGPVMMAGDAPAEGFYVAGGESIFARGLGAAAGPGPVRQAAVGGAAPWASEPSAARPRRAALPEDVQNAFRSTLEFIADPDGVRAQQHLPPAWAALEDVQEREEAQREAEELLGGAFDYAAVKRELERAKRASRLLQQAAGPAAPPSAAGSAAAAGGVPPKPAGSRGRAGNGPGTAGPGAAAVAGPPGMAAAPPGDFAGLLPPPHSVWDVDEAWFDLDEFTKAVEAEVAYRAAASVAPAGRGSPGPTLAGANGTATTPSAGQAAQTGRAGARLPGARATLAGGVTATAEGKGPGYADTAARSGGRKRASSPGPRTAASPVAATAEDMSPSPPRAVRKTQATGPVRVAFGRRVEEPSKATGPGASRTRAGSPPTARGSPGRARTRTRKVATSSAAVPPSPSSPGDAVHQVLSALASVLLSEGDVGDDDDDHDGDGRAATSGAEAPAGGAAGGRDLGREDGAACRGDHGAEVRTDAARQSPAPIPLQLPVERRTAAAGGSETPMPQQGQLAGPVQPPAAPISGQNSDRQSPIAAAAAPVAVAAAASSGAAAPPPWLPPPPVLPSWPSSTSKSRPRFQYVVDTAHPPVTVTRLPAWAASAVAAEGAPTAYAAALGAAPTGLGFGTPTRRRPPPAATASPSGMPFAAPAANMPMQQPFDVITGEAVPQAARGGRNFVAATNTTVLRFEQQEQRQVPQQQQLQQVFLAPADLPSNTHVLPPQAAAAAMAAAAAADAPAASRRARDPDPGQQWEKAVLQAVEDEVVSRLAAVQLAAQGRDPEISPQNLSGMVPPLVDLELSRRLVCDVLRDNLRSLMSSQRHQGQGAPAVQEDSGAPTLEEVVAALAAAQVLPPRLQQPQSQQESQQQRGNMRPCEGPGAQPGYVDAGGVSDCAADLPGVDELSRLAAATAGYADWAGSGAAYGMQARGVQAHGAEARGVQAYGVVEARAVQAYGAEARGTQAVGAQERGTQAAGVMDSSSQADPPLPHYLLQAALAAGLSYGAAPPQPNFTTTAGLGGGQQVLGPDGAPLTMPRPFYLVPADNTQRPASLNIYGAASGLALPPFARGEGSRPPLNLPGLSKLRDSSDVESSTDSMGRNLKGPGARARAAALEALRQASRFSLDSDDGLLQRSYAQLELATLTARPVQLEQHRLSSESAQPPAPGLGQPRAGKGGPHSQALSDPAAGAGSAAGGSGSGGAGALAWGDASRAHGQGAASHVASAGISGRGAPTYLTQAMGPSSNDSATWSHVTSLNAASQATGRSPGAVEDNDNTAGSVSPAPNSGGAANGASTASLNGASRVSSFAMSERSSAVPVAGQARQGSGDKDGSVGNASGASAASSGPARAHLSASPGGSAPRGSKDGSALPSGGLSHAASGASLASTAAAKSAVSGQDTPARPGAAGPGIPAAPATPAVADDELVGDEGDFEDGDDPDQIHSVYFSSSDDGRTARSRGSGHGGAASASADIPAAGGLRQASASGAGSAVGSGSANAVASRTGSQSLGASGRSNVADQEASPPPPAGQVVRNDGRATVAGGGGRYGVGAEEAGDFALSDDELLDDVEVARVLEEEDAKSAEDALEGEDERGLSEDDEELRQMEGQVTVLEDSDPEDEASAAAARPSPGAVDNQGGPADVAVFTTGLQEGSAVARGGRDEGVAKGGAAISATDGSVSERGDGSSSSGRKAHEASASASPRGVSVRSSSGAGNASVSWIDTQGPAGAAAGVGSKADDNEVALRVSTERAAHASLAPLGRLQSTTSSSGSGATRTTAAPPLSSSSQQQRSELGSTGTVPPVRPALAPLQTSAVRPAVSAMEGSGALQLPDSPGKRPSLANYHGPTRQLWRPPSAEPQDPLLSSSETLMASSEASGPVLDPLSRALLDGQRRAREVGPRSGLEAVAERARALGLDDSIGESSLDVSASADSVPASSVFQPRAAAGGTLPRSLAHSSRAGPLSPGVDSELDSDEEEGPAAPGGLRQATQPRTDAAGLGLPGRGSSRHDGAVFRLRQYGARRRKLMQQIGVQDPLLLSSAASLSTDSSTVSDSEDGDGYPSFARRG
ncbi:hypothetical protein PLESTM_000042200 [Pleodorina starrii]|nr:hypothetical protein PLESTM_000042200 [Pleodorina starrii]